MRNPNRDAAGASASLPSDNEASTPKSICAQLIGAVALPLSSPPAIGSIVLLHGSGCLCAIARYHGDGWWQVLDERFPEIRPTHWVVAWTIPPETGAGRPH